MFNQTEKTPSIQFNQLLGVKTAAATDLNLKLVCNNTVFVYTLRIEVAQPKILSAQIVPKGEDNARDREDAKLGSAEIVNAAT